jgi:hypothetical protein
LLRVVAGGPVSIGIFDEKKRRADDQSAAEIGDGNLLYVSRVQH